MTDEQLRKLAVAGIDLVEGIRRTGIQVADIRERYCRLTMPLAGNVNHVGMMYAGSLFTIGELPGGLIVLASYGPGKYVPIVKEVSIRFLAPAMSDVTLELAWSRETADELEQAVRERGKADFPLEMEIKDAAGNVVSVVTGLWQMRPMPRGGGNPFK